MTGVQTCALPIWDRDILEWSLDHALKNVQEALGGVIDNFPNRAVAWVLRPLVFPLGRTMKPPTDGRGAPVPGSILEDRAQLLSLSAHIYIPPADAPGQGPLESALAQPLPSPRLG